MPFVFRQIAILICLIGVSFCLNACALSSNNSMPEHAAEPEMTEEEKELEARRAAVIERLTAHYFARRVLFAAENEKLDNQDRFYVFAGDSLTEGFALEKYFPTIKTLNRGIVSDGVHNSPGMPTTTGLLNRMDETFFDTQPEAFFVLIGSNHMPKEYEDLDLLILNYRKMYDQVRDEFSDTPWIVTTLPPVGNTRKDRDLFNERVVAFNKKLIAFATEEKLPLIDLYSATASEDGILPDDLTRDGIHLSKMGYDVWATEVQSLLDSGALN